VTTVKTFLETATSKFQATGIQTARLDALILLEDATGKDRTWLLAHPEFVLSESAITLLQTQIERRAKHEPLAYIRGKSEFYGRSFMVSNETLVPRPETETIITLLRDVVGSWKSKVETITIVDVGTGSGCLAVTAKLEFPQAIVIATDISSACLKIANQNAKNLGAEVTFYQGDLLQPLPNTKYQIPNTVLANLPYVPNNYAINQAATHEPAEAIFGGSDGLNLYRRLFDQIKQLKRPPQHILTESLPFQHQTVQHMAKLHNYKLYKSSDFIQLFCRY